MPQSLRAPVKQTMSNSTSLTDALVIGLRLILITLSQSRVMHFGVGARSIFVQNQLNAIKKYCKLSAYCLILMLALEGLVTCRMNTRLVQSNDRSNEI